MKKIINLILVFVLIFNISMTNCFATSESYKTINVEYADNKGSIETLNVMVKDNNMFVDAYQLGGRLGYNVKLTENKNGVVIYNSDNEDRPRLLSVFYFDSTTVEYLLLNSIFKYEAPFKAVNNSRGIWVPFKYAVHAMNSSMLIIDDVVTISLPQNTLLNIMLRVVYSDRLNPLARTNCTTLARK